MIRHVVAVLGLLALSVAVVPAEAGFFDNLLQQLGVTGGKTSLSQDKIAAGLKEALTVGTENTVKLTGAVDGYFANTAIKILLPDNVRKIEDGLRLLGYGPKLDDFVLSMNRAAEKAAPYARDIFIGAIQQMTFDDARKILTGGDTAVTDFFKSKTYDTLLTTFTPVVNKELANYSVTAKYKAVMQPYQALPFAEKLPFLDVDKYVVTKSLDGLFYVLGTQERDIRQNPAARVTELLKEVFK